MECLRRRPTLSASLLVFALALGVRCAYWGEIRGTALDRWHLFDQSDMATYLRQASQFATQDWLATDPYHPYHNWQTVAPPDKWLAWYGPHAFHQAPGYAFAIALASRLVADPVPWFKLAQLLLGAGTAVVVLLLGERLGGLLAGCVAGVAAALHGPLVYLEAQLLREGPAIFALSLILLALLHVLARPPEAGRRGLVACAAIGAAIGLFHILHEMGLVLLLIAVVALGVRPARAGRAAWALGLAALLAGYVVGFAPLLARNVVVGAAPFAVSCRTVINFALANEAGAPDGGATFAAPSSNVVAILDGAHGRLLGVLRGVWATYHGHVGQLFGNWLGRFAAVWQWPEAADSTSFYFYRAHSRTLAVLPTFSALFPLGFAGAVAVVCSRGSWKRAWLRHPAGHATMLLYVGAVAGALSLVQTVARFRLYVLPFFFVYAGVAVALAASSWRAKRAGGVAVLALAVVAGVFVQRAATVFEDDVHNSRFVDFAVATMLAAREGQLSAVAQFAGEGVARPLARAEQYVFLGGMLESAGESGRASEAYRQALALDPALVAARQGLERVSR